MAALWLVRLLDTKGAEPLLLLGDGPTPPLPLLPGGEAEGALRMSGGGFSCWGFGSRPADATGATLIGPTAAWVIPARLAVREDCSLGIPPDFILCEYNDEDGGSGLSPPRPTESPGARGREPSRTEVSLTKLGWSVPMGVASPELGGLWTGVLLGVGSSIVGEVREERGVNMVGGISVGDASGLVAWGSAVCVCVCVQRVGHFGASAATLNHTYLQCKLNISYYLSLSSCFLQVPLHSDA